MRIRLLVLAVTSCSVLVGQNTDSIVKIVRVRGNAPSVANLAAAHSGVNYMFSDELHAIVLRGKPADVENVEQTIQQLDAFSNVPSPKSKNIETTIYVIAGSAQPIAGLGEITEGPLTAVVRQLRSIFPYRHYQTLSTMLIRSAQDAKGSTEGVLQNPISGPESLQPSRYQISYDSARISSDSVPSIRLNNFVFSARITYSRRLEGAGTQIGQVDASLRTDVDLREGQQVVVGKTNVTDSDTCFFVILSARLVP